MIFQGFFSKAADNVLLKEKLKNVCLINDFVVNLFYQVCYSYCDCYIFIMIIFLGITCIAIILTMNMIIIITIISEEWT